MIHRRAHDHTSKTGVILTGYCWTIRTIIDLPWLHRGGRGMQNCLCVWWGGPGVYSPSPLAVQHHWSRIWKDRLHSLVPRLFLAVRGNECGYTGIWGYRLRWTGGVVCN